MLHNIPSRQQKKPFLQQKQIELITNSILEILIVIVIVSKNIPQSK